MTAASPSPTVSFAIRARGGGGFSTHPSNKEYDPVTKKVTVKKGSLLGPRIVPRVARKFLVRENSTNHCTWRSHGHDLVLDSDDARN